MFSMDSVFNQMSVNWLKFLFHLCQDFCLFLFSPLGRDGVILYLLNDKLKPVKKMMCE